MAMGVALQQPPTLEGRVEVIEALLREHLGVILNGR